MYTLDVNKPLENLFHFGLPRWLRSGASYEEASIHYFHTACPCL